MKPEADLQTRLQPIERPNLPASLIGKLALVAPTPGLTQIDEVDREKSLVVERGPIVLAGYIHRIGAACC